MRILDSETLGLWESYKRMRESHDRDTAQAVAIEREAIAAGHDKRCDWHLNRARMLEAIPEAQERDARALERSGDHYEQSRFHAESAQAIRSGEHVKP